MTDIYDNTNINLSLYLSDVLDSCSYKFITYDIYPNTIEISINNRRWFILNSYDYINKLNYYITLDYMSNIKEEIINIIYKLNLVYNTFLYQIKPFLEKDIYILNDYVLSRIYENDKISCKNILINYSIEIINLFQDINNILKPKGLIIKFIKTYKLTEIYSEYQLYIDIHINKYIKK